MPNLFTGRQFSPRRFLIELEQFLFAPAQPITIRFFRVALAAMLAWTFWPQHLVLAQALRAKPFWPDFYHDIVFTAAYHTLIAVLLLAFAFGWRPRLIGFILLALLLPLDFLIGQQQSRQILLFTLLAFCFWPDDVTSSVRGRNQIFAPPIWPLRLMQIQLSLVYGINALAKTTPHFLSGEALMWMSQLLPNFRVDLSDGFLHLATLAVPAWLLACATVLTEYFLATAFWLTRRRMWVAFVGVAFHLVLKMVIKIGMLDWASMFLYLTFLLPFECRQNGSTPTVGKAQS